MITFKECMKEGYPARTALNVTESDLTIAIAVDFSTRGEILTKSLCKKQNKLYVPVLLTDEISEERLNKIAMFINNNPVPGNGRIINIAGNGIYTLPKAQGFYNNWMANFIGKMEFCLGSHMFISGGQTGIDEAGIVAANKLGYDCHINAPKSWRFITKNGREITDETMFKSRFI